MSKDKFDDLKGIYASLMRRIPLCKGKLWDTHEDMDWIEIDVPYTGVKFMFMIGPESNKKRKEELGKNKTDYIGVCFGHYSESESKRHGGFSGEEQLEYVRLEGETDKQFFLRVVESTFLKYYNQEKADLMEDIKAEEEWGGTAEDMLEEVGMTPKGLKILKKQLGFKGPNNVS